MQISYESNIDQWIATQIFHVEQLSSLKKLDKKNLIKLILYLIILDVFVFFTGGANAFFWYITIFLAVWILYLLFRRSKIQQKLIYQRLQTAYGPEFEKEKDRTVTWDVTSEQIIVRDSSKEVRLNWSNIQKITVCPEFLFIHFGLSEFVALPKQCVPEAEYRAFCDCVIQTYQEHAAEHGKTAEIIQSGWAIDLEQLQKKTYSKSSPKKIFFTILWAIAFLVVGMLFLGVIVFSIDLFIMLCSDSYEEIETASTALPLIWLGGSVLLMVLGTALGLNEKLPGTKIKVQTDLPIQP